MAHLVLQLSLQFRRHRSWRTVCGSSLPSAPWRSSAFFFPLTTWIENRRKEREAFYKAETIRRIAEAPGNGGKAAIELLREQERIARSKLAKA